MNNILLEENITSADSHDEDIGENSLTPILSVADFDGNGSVEFDDIYDLASRYNAVAGEDDYHPIYDLNTNGEIDLEDILDAIDDYGEDVPLQDRQIAQATQATMKYYGSGGLEQAIEDGYLPFTQEVKGHGVHYVDFNLLVEVANSKELDVERPIGLNYDAEGNLLAVFYIRVPETQEVTPDNPFGNLFVKEADDFPPSSFDTLTADDWHIHQNIWFTGLGNLNSESVYGFEEGLPFEAMVSRLQNIDFKVFPESDEIFSPKFWMLHGWFHSLNPAGTFANTHPEVSKYAPEELGVHAGHHSDNSDPVIAGTDAGEQLFGTDENDRINGFDGDDWIIGGLGDDSVWGGHGDDWIRGEGGDDMLYGGPGYDLIRGNAGSDRLFGGTEDDRLLGEAGDDLIRGGMGYDILTGGEGEDSFVLVAGEGTDVITDLELELDTIVLYGGISTEAISIGQLNNDTTISFDNETLALVSNIAASDLIAASDDVFLVA
ncbi:MAG: calcium-binding protein [Xenococcaceae cyanobacterium]